MKQTAASEAPVGHRKTGCKGSSSGVRGVTKTSVVWLWKHSLCIHRSPGRLYSRIFHFSSAEAQLLADNADVWISKTEIASFCHQPEERAPRGPRPLQHPKPSVIVSLGGSNCSAQSASAARIFPFIKASSLFCFNLSSLFSKQQNISRQSKPVSAWQTGTSKHIFFVFWPITSRLWCSCCCWEPCRSTQAAKTANTNIHRLQTQKSERRERKRWMASEQRSARTFRTRRESTWLHTERRRRTNSSKQPEKPAPRTQKSLSPDLLKGLTRTAGLSNSQNNNGNLCPPAWEEFRGALLMRWSAGRKQGGPLHACSFRFNPTSTAQQTFSVLCWFWTDMEMKSASQSLPPPPAAQISFVKAAGMRSKPLQTHRQIQGKGKRKGKSSSWAPQTQTSVEAEGSLFVSDRWRAEGASRARNKNKSRGA